MIYANNGIICGSEWNHNPELKNKQGQTVEMILKSKGINIPDEWIVLPYNIRRDKDGNTMAMR